MPQQNEEMLKRIYRLSDQDKFTAKFPQDIQNVPHIAIFRAYKFQRLSRQEYLRKDCIAEITLPMPSNLNTTYHAEYATPSIGALFENLVSKVNNSATPANLSGMFTKFDSDTAIKAAKAATGVAVSDLIRGEPGATAIGAFGVARNPHKIVMYQGSDFRTHSFEYQFTPKNQKESFEITNIIKAFKFYMSASYGIGKIAAGSGNIAEFIGASGTEVANFAREAAAESRAFFEYPEVFRITLMPDGQTDNPHIFQIAECVLEDFKVDYDPQGGARYVRGENNVPAPASVKISMTFKETSLVTKDNIRDNVYSQRDLVGSLGARATGVETGSGL